MKKMRNQGPLKMPERPTKPALPLKLPHKKMTLELYNQGVMLESEPESDEGPVPDPEGLFCIYPIVKK